MKNKDGVFIPKSRNPLYGKEIRVNLNYKSVLKKMVEDKKMFSECIKGDGDINELSKELGVELVKSLDINNK